MTSVVIHGHFYQPPREDPWTDRVPREASAAPFHNWNERITHECYRPLAGSGLLEWMSFDVGPTLLQWLEREARDVYERVLDADRISRDRLGHGNAIAQPYHHVILPLASERDKRTEVRWGVADFERRFGRRPAGMWLPETAVDGETLEVLADEGIAFTILSPPQVEEVPPRGLPGAYRTTGGRELAIFVYDGTLSHGVAFGELLRDPEAWLSRVEALAAEEDPGAAGSPRLISLATDGETYGHHHYEGLSALAHVLDGLRARTEFHIDNFAAFLAKSPPRHPIRIVEPSSWSCAHGIERWRAACGCKMAPEEESHQEWRNPLREALTWLAGKVHAYYEREAEPLLARPWAARDGFGAVVRSTLEERRAYAASALREGDASPPAREGSAPAPDPSHPAVDRVLELLEIERDALRGFTSCAWFFDDVGGLEPLQILKYAGHAIDGIAREDPETARALEAGFLERLARAASNDPEIGDAARLYRERVLPSRGEVTAPAEVTAPGEPAAPE